VERKTHRESWKGEESVKERFTLTEEKMVPFLEGEYTLETAQADLRAKVPVHPLSRGFSEADEL
jgi:SPX domain protein involved in polyphosphate accumulation